jgi:hypothetical protein
MNLHPWQQEMLKKMSGFKKGELCLWTAGRQTGKSTITQYMAQWQELMGEKYPYRRLTQAPVDGQMWYTVRCNSEVAKWLRDSQGISSYYAHPERNVFDVCEAVYIQMGLKFQ